MQLEASPWDHEPSIFVRSMPPVEQIDINTRQKFAEFNKNNYKDRVNGFRIAAHELLELSRSGSASTWRLSRYSDVGTL